MTNPIIPTPVRFDGDGSRVRLRSGARIVYRADELAPTVERFSAEIAGRTGLRVAPLTGDPGADEPSVRLELAATDELGALPTPQGLSPTGDRPADERYSLTIDADRVVLRAAEPVGVARPDHARPAASRGAGRRGRGGHAA